MSTLQTIASTDTLNPTSLGKINDNFSTLNTDKAEKSGWTFTGDIVVPDEAYWAWWDGSLEVPTKNAIYDKIQSMPALSDWDKGDIVVSDSGATWTVDSGVITNAKLANVASATFKGRTTVGTGSPEDMTATQATALLNTATTSLKGLMSSADKTKLDSLSNEWTALTNSTYTAGGTYNSGTLTAYDLYKIVISGTSTAWSTQIRMQVNSDWTASSYETKFSTSTSTSISTLTDNSFKILNHNVWSGSPFYTELIMTSSSCKITNASWQLADWELINWGYKSATVSSIQLSTIIAISGKIQIFGKNF